MTTKLEIIGPYTPDHPGPYAIAKNDIFPIPCHVHSVVEGTAFVTSVFMGRTPFLASIREIKNAREVRVPREVWVNEYNSGYGDVRNSEEEATHLAKINSDIIRTIHFREVVEGE